nr:DEAD/DEAH box helicase [Acidobacteriota bacterium]
MQISHGAVTGARGWLWRVERIETFGPEHVTLVHLARPSPEGTRRWIAVRPFEPMSVAHEGGEMRPVPVTLASGAVADARQSARPAFAIGAAERLSGDIHPWQLAAALAFERGHSRVLLADGVGMGKTVSAALAIAQCLGASGEARCLIIVPGHLAGQWVHELRRRVAIEARLIDAPALRRAASELPAGRTVWSMPGCLIASSDFLKQPHVLPQLTARRWDLLVIDEAHLVCGASERHAAAASLARRSRHVLLLTATPSDGDGHKMRALDTLGAADPAEPIIWLRHAARPPARMRRITVRSDPAVAALHAAIGDYAAWIAAGPCRHAAGIQLLAPLLVKRALSSTHAARISIGRRQALLGTVREVQPSLFDIEDDPGVLGAGSGHPMAIERARLDRLRALADAAVSHDTRLHTLIRLMRRTCEPAVIFTCFRDTAVLIATRLSRRMSVRLAHGGLAPAALDEAIGAFIDGPARVLVATDVAAQGLNLHARCRRVVHYDLPWRPSTLRQRDGRVDRLGQSRTPHSTLLVDRTPLAESMTRRVAGFAARMTQH